MTIGQTTKHPEWRVIVDIMRALDYGQSVTHTTICEATGLRPETRGYYRHVSQARKVLLRDHSIEIEAEAKVGYRRVEPDRYGERSQRDVRLGGKRIRRARRVIAAAPAHLLSAQQVRELEHSARKLNLLIAQMHSTIRSMKNILPPVVGVVRPLLETGQPDEATGTEH